ncbi:putative protoporphyrinogen oxidase [Lunatimonas lonarensis]|uniref:peptide chain release factor N(5)-glutamine methyltransferase n=2 Tax=Lunatimonas lonarensis TaxID=1232681 RepID=R7ZNT8_9BACT|nr:putative protoporphyrinogen oxidase [Lunatimonas lonarensis]
MGLSRVDILLDRPISEVPLAYSEALEQVLAGVPIQYVLGEALFYGRTFLVDSNVLIPRRETEELVHWIIQAHPQSRLRVLDIGTGSGCIPITLALELQHPSVHALDISEHALGVAKKNAQRHHVAMAFHQLDVLNDALPPGGWDIIVSNPPYVTQREATSILPHVLDHEPHLALFVPDHAPLLFYAAITSKAMDSLVPGGMLYVEINESFGEETRQLFLETGLEKVEIKRDMQGKDRMVRGQKPLLG